MGRAVANSFSATLFAQSRASLLDFTTLLTELVLRVFQRMGVILFMPINAWRPIFREVAPVPPTLAVGCAPHCLRSFKAAKSTSHGFIVSIPTQTRNFQGNMSCWSSINGPSTGRNLSSSYPKKLKENPSLA